MHVWLLRSRYLHSVLLGLHGLHLRLGDAVHWHRRHQAAAQVGRDAGHRIRRRLHGQSRPRLTRDGMLTWNVGTRRAGKWIGCHLGHDLCRDRC